MKKINNAVAWVSGAFLVFAVLCTPLVEAPLWFLLIYLLCLKIALVVVVVITLKHGEHSRYTFDEKFYEDV
jgi:hypothetical protein